MFSRSCVFSSRQSFASTTQFPVAIVAATAERPALLGSVLGEPGFLDNNSCWDQTEQEGRLNELAGKRVNVHAGNLLLD